MNGVRTDVHTADTSILNENFTPCKGVLQGVKGWPKLAVLDIISSYQVVRVHQIKTFRVFRIGFSGGT